MSTIGLELNSMSKILVTGGLGTLGSYVVKKLEAAGHEVWVADLPHNHRVRYYRMDVGAFRQVERVLEKENFDGVYHLAAEFGRWNGEDYYENLWRSNAVGTKNIIRMQEKLGFKLIHASSSEVYGDYAGEMSEDVMDLHEVKQMNDYAMTKWVNEMQILNSAAQFDSKTVRIRIFNTYGPGEYYSLYRSVVCRFMYSALHSVPFTVYRGHTRTHTYIEDAATWIARIWENFKPGTVYNIAGSERHSIEKVAELVLKSAKASPNIVTYEASEILTTKDKIVSNASLLRDLGTLPEVPFEQGLDITRDWMKKVYNI
jgi:dTDP-glucose 4,6-dehydratase